MLCGYRYLSPTPVCPVPPATFLQTVLLEGLLVEFLISLSHWSCGNKPSFPRGGWPPREVPTGDSGLLGNGGLEQLAAQMQFGREAHLWAQISVHEGDETEPAF